MYWMKIDINWSILLLKHILFDKKNNMQNNMY